MGHSRLAASASSRWLKCSGSIRLVEYLKRKKIIPQDTTNDAAQLGTAVHYIIEQVLLGKKKIRDFRGKSIKADGMEKSFVMTSKELKNARMCIKYATKVLRKYKKAKMFPERKYDLTKIYKIEMGGTSDITFAVKFGMLEITDYKNGKWPVEIWNNSQLRIYGLGAYYALNNKYNFKKIKLTIVQPNCNHEDGPIRSETITIKKLIKWEREVLVPVLEDIKAGKDKLIPDEENQCAWCEAKAHCPARQKNKPKLVKDVLNDLIPITDIDTLPDPENLSKKELINALQNADKVIKFYKDCKKYALTKLEKNREYVDGWDLVPKLGNRTFKDKLKLRKALKKNKINTEDITIHQDREMTVSELEKYLRDELEWDKSKVSKFMDDVTTRAQSGYALVKVETAEDDFAEFAKTKTKRQKK